MLNDYIAAAVENNKYQPEVSDLIKEVQKIQNKYYT